MNDDIKLPRLIGTLTGDIQKDSGAKVKYGYFFEDLEKRFPITAVFDASLKGPDRIFNMLLTFHPNQRVWRERYYKNLPAFGARTRRIASQVIPVQDQADLILQLGVLFNSRGHGVRLPAVIYTDYTARLAAERPEGGRSPFTPEQRLRWIELEKRAFLSAAHVCTRSRLVRQSILEHYGLSEERVSVVGGGVNYPALPEVVCHQPEDRPTALFIGKDLFRKGGDILLRAFARARSRVPEATLLFLTGDPIPEGLPLEGVELIRPTWDRKTISALYQRARVFVLPSRLETWGDVLLEAMSHGLPTIGVAGQAMEEVIVHETSGLLVPEGDEQALADALVRLFTNPELRRAWGQAARERVEAKFTWEQVVRRMEPILKEAACLSKEVGR